MNVLISTKKGQMNGRIIYPFNIPSLRCKEKAIKQCARGKLSKGGANDT